MKSTAVYNEADLVLRTKEEPTDWKYSLSGSIDNVTVNGNQVCYRSDFDLLRGQLTAAQAEIAELKELIKREVVPDVKDAEIARLQSALDVAVEVLGATWPNVFQEIYEHHQAAIDKIKQIRGEK